MVPMPARRGRLILATGALFIVIGALYASASIVALGVASTSAVMTAYLVFFPTAVLLRRRKIELSWWVPPGDQPGGALTADRPFRIHLAVRNHGARRLRVLAMDLFGTRALELPEDLEAHVPAGHQVEVVGEARSRSAGYQVLHGAVATFGDALGLFEVRAYFPNPIAIKVFPHRAGLRGSGAMRPSGSTMHERVGLHRVKRRGLAGELREIREHQHGDPFKFIAWKATARRQKLMVRDLDTEIVVTYRILLDISGTMRNQWPGHSKLDYSVEVASALAKTTLDAGDRVGLLTFDSRVYSELRPGDGHHHYLKLVDRLLETQNVVDEDLTDLTNGELVAAVARYLAHQEAIDVRLRRAPPLDDPAWERIQAGPSGELYDMAALGRVVQSLLRSMNSSTKSRNLAPAWWWSRVPIAPESDPAMARLRLFCRLRGLELPYRMQHPHGRRADGLLEAAERATIGGRSDVAIVLTDLGGVIEKPSSASTAFARLRRSAARVVVIAPFGPAFLPVAESDAAHRVAKVLHRSEDETLGQATRLLSSWGIPVLRAGPEDSPAALLGRMNRTARAGRRVA